MASRWYSHACYKRVARENKDYGKNFGKSSLIVCVLPLIHAIKESKENQN